MESEADHIGCELLARACLIPKNPLILASNESGREESSWYCVARRWLLEHLGLFSTHPATSRRIADIQNGCRSCCKLENLRDAMSMEDFIILIRLLQP